MKNNNENFLDSRTLLAILLVGSVFVGWQFYMQKKYPDAYAKKPEASTPVANNPSAENPNAKPSDQKVAVNSVAPEASVQTASGPEKTWHYQSENLAFDISSHGMGVRTFEILKYKNRAGKTVDLGHPEDNILPLETRLLGHQDSLEFQVEQVNPNLFVGHAQSGNVKITKTMEINPDKYLIDFKVVASGIDDQFIGLSTALAEEVGPLDVKDSPHPQHQKQEFYVDAVEAQNDRYSFDKSDVEKSWSRVKMASVGSQYFTQLVFDKSSVMPDAKAHLRHGTHAADILLQYTALNKTGNFELNYGAFVGPKSVSILRDIDPQLVKVADFGRFGFIGRYILEILKWFYGVVGNWGIAIICLTLLVRLIVLPANVYSYKSMRSMQAIQPELKALREKYKDDQQKQQQETMALMKQHKVNPLGGCLPLLLQFPIFFALYQMLGNSIELYQAPFGLWIHDLSLRDPFYILPVLMGLTMFVQQKITPNTMDPAQAKIMLMMPLIFTFFMVQVPSGLTLYMVVGAVFSVVQQTYFMKQSKTPSSVVAT